MKEDTRGIQGILTGAAIVVILAATLSYLGYMSLVKGQQEQQELNRLVAAAKSIDSAIAADPNLAQQLIRRLSKNPDLPPSVTVKVLPDIVKKPSGGIQKILRVYVVRSDGWQREIKVSELEEIKDEFVHPVDPNALIRAGDPNLT